MAMASTVLTSVTASAPAPRAAPATSATSATVGLSLAHRGSAGQDSPTAATTSAVAEGEWANIRRRSSRFGQLTLTSRATMPGTPASAAAALAKSSTRWPQMLTTTRAPAATQAGQVPVDPGVDPGALQPDAVEHPRRRLVHAGRRVAGPRVDRQRLDHHRAELGEREVGAELVGVAGGPRRRHDRVGQRERPDPRPTGRRLRR